MPTDNISLRTQIPRVPECSADEDDNESLDVSLKVDAFVDEVTSAKKKKRKNVCYTI